MPARRAPRPAHGGTPAATASIARVTVAWRRSLGAGLLLGLAIGCGWLAYTSYATLPRILLAAGALSLAALGLLLMVPFSGNARWRATWERRMEFQFTTAGIPFFAAVVILTLIAFSTGNNLVYLVVAGLLAALLVSGLTSTLNLSGMTLRFHLPEDIYAGQPTPVAFTLVNEKSFWPSWSLTVAAASEPVGGGEGGAEMRPVYFTHLARRGSMRVDSEIRFPRRGLYSSAAFWVMTRFPFGLVNKRRRFQAGMREPETLVFPEPLSPEQVRAASPHLGLYREQYRRGSGQELYRIRPHQVGDSVRSVHWKISAHAGELRVREFSQEGAQRIRLRLSLPPSLPAGEAEAAISLCAGLVLALSENDIWIEFRGDHPAGDDAAGVQLPLGPAAQLQRRILEYLALVDPTRLAGGGTDAPAPVEDLFQEIVISGAGGAAARPATAGAAAKPPWKWTPAGARAGRSSNPGAEGTPDGDGTGRAR